MNKTRVLQVLGVAVGIVALMMCLSPGVGQGGGNLGADWAPYCGGCWTQNPNELCPSGRLYLPDGPFLLCSGGALQVCVYSQKEGGGPGTCDPISPPACGGTPGYSDPYCFVVPNVQCNIEP